MKKILSVLLSLVMILGCSVTLLLNVSAQTTDSDAIEAPVPMFTQETATVNNTQNIRFIAGVKNLNASKLGYEVVAEFKHENSYRSVTYGGENYESTKVFEYVLANGTPYYTKDMLGENTEYKYWFPLTLTGVPTNVGDIFFRIRTYAIDSNGAKIYSDEICAQYVNGELDDTLNVQTFSKLNGEHSGDITTGAAITAGGENTGWVVAKGVAWHKDFGDIVEFKNGNARIHTDGDTLRLVDGSAFEGLYKYSVELDITIKQAGIVNFMLCDNTSSYTDFLRIRLGAQSGNFISGSADAFTENDGKSLAVLNYVDGTQIGSTKAIEGTAMTDKLHLTVDVDNTTRLMSVYINGVLIETCCFAAGFGDVNGFYSYIENADVYIDNLRVYGEEYDSNAKGELLYKQDFNSLSGKMEGGSEGFTNSSGSSIKVGNQDTGLVLATSLNWTNTYSDFVEFNNATARIHTNGDYIRLIDSSVFSGTYKYSIDVDVKVTEAGIINFAFNDDTLTNVLRVRLGASDGISGATSGHTEASNKDLGIQLVAGTMFSAGTTVKVNGKKLTDAFHLTIDVNNYNRNAVIYVDGTLITSISFGAEFVNVGGLYTYIQGGDITIDNLTVYGEKPLSEAGEAGDVVYMQDFSSVSGSTTDEVLASAGMNVIYENNWSFADKKYAEVTSNGALKLNGGGTAYEIVSGKYMQNAATDKFTLQFDLTAEYLGVMELMFTDSNGLYSSNLNATSVMFRNFPNDNVNLGKWNNGTTAIGYTVQNVTNGTKTDLVNAPAKVGDASAYGTTYKVVVEMDVGNSIKISIYNGTEQVVTTTVAQNICDDVNSISIRLQGAPITIDNVILSVGTYSDYCL